MLQTCFHFLVIFSLTRYQRIVLSFGSEITRNNTISNLLSILHQNKKMTSYVPVAFLACRGAWGRGYQSFLQLGFEIKVGTKLLSQGIKTAFYL